MKSISTQELKSNLDAILSSVQGQRMLISRRGKPCAVLVGVEDYDAEDLQLSTSDEFWRMIGARRSSGKSVPLSELEARLQARTRKPAKKRTTPSKSRKRS
ncbi:MAG TPA: type II toxin-antitoxin system Phd/YefM family antitoxin, partial [Pirellulales bacterium]|nr:type II toxin-antitoxin system Phd/YefM family antitoxin [Pirellulales bacterium]